MLDTTKKIQRSAEIAGILIKYGFEDLVARLPWNKKQTNSTDTTLTTSEQDLYKRIRQALEELGPIFVKLAQTLSTREGMFPDELILEFKKLEDQVDGEQNLDITSYLESELDIKVSEHFQEVDLEPLAAASISEVFKAKLKTGEKVILKLRRPNIIDKVQIDLALIKDLAQMLHNYQPKLRNLNLPLIASSFEQTILEELSFDNERKNMLRFAENFEENPNIYVPKVYEAYSNDAILCMEFIDGIKITDLPKDSEAYNIPEIVQSGLHLYLDQIIHHGFFHGDPHPGNILVRENNQIVFLDFGNMGKLLASDKKQLESFIFSVVLGDIDWLSDVIKETAIVQNIKDDATFKRSIAEILDMIENSSLGEINVSVIIDKLWEIIIDNALYFPEYIYQLIRGITLMEGIGRKLYPELSIYASLRPYAKNLFLKRIEPKNLWKENKAMLSSYMRMFYTLPENLNHLISQLKSGNIQHNHQIDGLNGINQTVKRGVSKIVLAIMFMSLLLLSGFIIVADLEPKALGLPVWALVFLIAALGIVLLFIRNYIKDKKRQ